MSIASVKGLFLCSAVVALSYLLKSCHGFSIQLSQSTFPRRTELYSSSSVTSFDAITHKFADALPIFDILEDVLTNEQSNLLLEAAPGAGKTTVVPLALALPSSRKIVLVEPRRIATKSAAFRMADMLGESVGQSVGYAIRGESKIGKNTLVQVMTDGVLLNKLREDPELSGIDVVIFDEFHERGVGSDTALALCRESQKLLRPDLKLVVMSATLLGSDSGEDDDESSTGAKLLRTLGGQKDCRVLQSPGQRPYPVEIQWLNKRGSPPLGALLLDSKLLVSTMVDTIEDALRQAPARGDILAFLPGAREIRKVVQQLSRVDADVFPLFGALPKEEQDRAIYGSRNGRQRIIVASPIAEASLTIEGVTCVVDSGLRREPRYDVDTGMPRLVTVRCSRDSIIQRTGRAGRTQEGICLRLFSETEWDSDDSKFQQHAPPEIHSTDLTPTTLLLTDWGCSRPSEILNDLPFVDPPPKDSLQKAHQLLVDLKALEGLEDGDRYRVTPDGQTIAKLPTHPRLATCIVEATHNSGDSFLVGAVIAAAVLDDEFGGAVVSRGRGSTDLAHAVQKILQAGVSSSTGRIMVRYAGRIGEKARQAVTSALQDAPQNDSIMVDVVNSLGEALLPGFIDLIAQYKGEASYGGSSYMLSLGRTARLDDIRDAGDFLVVTDTSTGDDGKARIRSFVKINSETLERAAVEQDELFTVPSRGHEVRARRVRKVGYLELSSSPLPAPSAEDATKVLLKTIRSLGGVKAALFQTQSKEIQQQIAQLRGRVRLAMKQHTETLPEGKQEWPACFRALDAFDTDNTASDEDETVLVNVIEPWLSAASSLKKIDVVQALISLFSTDQLLSLNTDFPEKIEAPDGSSIPVSYLGETPTASAKLQQFFSATASPCVGTLSKPIPISISLLSPAKKLLAQTVDLPFFWKETYPSVRAEMRGKYPKHPWPEDPMNTAPTRLSKKQLAAQASDDDAESGGKKNNKKKGGKKKRGKK